MMDDGHPLIWGEGQKQRLVQEGQGQKSMSLNCRQFIHRLSHQRSPSVRGIGARSELLTCQSEETRLYPAKSGSVYD